jgi:hypothetical protein
VGRFWLTDKGGFESEGRVNLNGFTDFAVNRGNLFGFEASKASQALDTNRLCDKLGNIGKLAGFFGFQISGKAF